MTCSLLNIGCGFPCLINGDPVDAPRGLCRCRCRCCQRALAIFRFPYGKRPGRGMVAEQWHIAAEVLRVAQSAEAARRWVYLDIGRFFFGSGRNRRRAIRYDFVTIAWTGKTHRPCVLPAPRWRLRRLCFMKKNPVDPSTLT